MTYKDISILNFQKLISAVKHHDDNAYEVGIEILDIFENVPRLESESWLVNDFNERLAKYSFLNELPSEDNWVKEFELNKVKYKVIQTPDKWNVGQYVSISNLTKDSNQVIDNLHLILAVMCVGDDGLTIKERSGLFQDKLDIQTAYPIALFFCAVMAMLPPNTLHYLKEAGLQIGLTLNGDGMTH